MTAENFPLISLIIPVFNAKETIHKCLSCALSQSYPNYDILLVDDGSFDGTEAVCDAYAKQHDNVSVIHHQRNFGLSAARNAGISGSSGDYIAFMDADDLISRDYLLRLYELCREFDTGIAACNHNIIRGSRTVSRFPAGEKHVLLGEKEICENILYQKKPDVSAWGKLYARSVLEHIEYPVGKLYEDTSRIAEIVFRGGKIAFTHEPLYEYIISHSTLSHGKYTPGKYEYIEAVNHMTQLIEAKYPEMKKGCVCRRVFAALSVRRFFSYDPDADPDVKSRLEAFVRKNAFAVLFNIHTPKRDKIAVLSLLIDPRFFDMLWRFYDSRREGK